jgi:GTP-binding protein
VTTKLPVIVLVGRQNVGKSTLFNRLTNSRDALVMDMPGLTRDRQYGFGAHEDKRFIVVDTGGLSPEVKDEFSAMAADQAKLALSEADVVLFMTDARAGLTPVDQAIARDLRKLGKPVRLLVNKAEGMSPNVLIEFTRLGFENPALVSAEHGQGLGALLTALLEPYETSEKVQEGRPDGIVRIAIVGRPNVGKSTLVNRLCGEVRVLAADAPGTTRDAISVPFKYKDRDYILIDTAGIRRRAKVTEHVEKLSIVKALQAVDQADVVVAVVDGREDIGSHDARLLGLVAEHGKGLVCAVNKWDGLTEYSRSRVREVVDFKLPFLEFMPLHYISAQEGSGLGDLMKDVDAVYRASKRELKTPELTRALEKFVFDHQPPAVIGRRIKLRYAHAGGRNPPLIVIHGNQTERLPESYKRYLVNEFRREFDLRGMPLRLEFKSSDNPYKGKKNVLTGRQVKKRKRMMERRKR